MTAPQKTIYINFFEEIKPERVFPFINFALRFFNNIAPMLFKSILLLRAVMLLSV